MTVQVQSRMKDLPIGIIVVVIIQLMLQTATVYASTLFSMQHGIFDWWVALIIAIGIALAYITGMVFANNLRSGGWSLGLTVFAGLTDITFGMLYVLGKYNVIPPHPEGVTAILLAGAHIIPFIVMSALTALTLHASGEQDRDDQKKAEDRTRKLQDQQDAYRDDQSRIAHAQAEKEIARLNAQAQKSRGNPGKNASHAQGQGNSESQPVQNAENAMHDGIILCLKCNSLLVVPIGKDPKFFQKATKRWGCEKCKVKTDADANAS